MHLIYKFIAVALLGAVVGSGLTFVMVERSPVVSVPVAVSPVPENGFQAKTYTYYKVHPDEAKRRNAECANKGVNGMADTPEGRDCEVAREVAHQ